MIPGCSDALQSKEVTLNGKLLKRVGTSMPSLDGKILDASDPIVLPETSYGFVHFDVDVEICRKGNVEST